MKVCADPSIIMELAEEFTYYIPNHKYHPKVKARVWDGRMSLINRLSGYCYVGLAQKIKKFCESRGYGFTFDDEFYYDNISRKELEDHIKSLNIPEKFNSRDYQFESVLKCIKSRRKLLLSPTSSGKSMMIYLIASWYKQKTLIIVPTTGLVNQFEDDLREYGYKGKIVTSIGGLLRDNNIDADIVISTWQSLNNGKSKMPKDWYNQFKVVFGDECFVKGSKVLTPNGYVNIENIKIGDEIINYCELNNQFKVDYVEEVFTNVTSCNDILELKFDNGNVIRCTKHHKFLTKNGWKEADDILETDEIINIQ